MGKSYPLWELAHAYKSFNMSPLMKNKFPNERKGRNPYLVRLISPFLTLGPFSPMNTPV